MPHFFSMFLACLATLWAATGRAHEPAGAKVDFLREIRPIFAKHCFKCHGPDEEEGGLRLDDRKRALAGGATGPPIVPGKAADSLLWQLITGRNEDRVIMPPKGRGERLTEAKCELVRRWIDQGAVWPDEAQRAEESSCARPQALSGPKRPAPNRAACKRAPSETAK